MDLTPQKAQSATVPSATNANLTLLLSESDGPLSLIRIEIHEASIIYVKPDELSLAVNNIVNRKS